MKNYFFLLLIGMIALNSCHSAPPADRALREQIAEQTALFRQGQVPTDSTLCALVASTREAGDKQALCHALYLQGAVCNYTTRYDKVIPILKEAETLIPFLEEDDPTAGMIYVVQGSALEQNDYLWTEASGKYKAALPFFARYGDTLRMATCYRDIARMSLWRADTVQYEQAFAQAIALAEKQPNRLIYHDIRMQYLLNHFPPDTLAMMEENQILCDSFGLYRYAWIPAEYYLRHRLPDSAQYWLQGFANDTIYTRWSAEKYRWIRGKLLFQDNQTENAYNELQDLYQSTMHRIYIEGLSRTYAIARQYDLERERQKSLQLQIDKQRLWLLIGGITVLLLVSLLWLLWERSKRLRKEQEVAHKREALKRILQQRVALAVRLRRRAEGLPKGLPAWAKNYLEENAFTNDTDWQEFMQEFNSAYGDWLGTLHKQYPALTEQDNRYLALARLGLDNTEIAVLLNASDRTIWNRRQKIKTRLGNSHMDLDAWLQE